VAFPLRSAAEKSITVAQFRNLSLRLTGDGLSDLDPTTAAKLLDGFMSMGRGSDLADLITSGATSGALAEIQYRDDAEGAGHIMGTARMGGDPKQSLVDRFAATIIPIFSSSARLCFQRPLRPIQRSPLRR